jgi:hypothetical protein
MLNQFDPIIGNLPTVMTIVFQIVILVFAVRMRKNSYKYGLTLMLSAILSLVYSTLYFFIQFQDLYYLLVIVQGLPYGLVSTIMTILSFVFLGLNTASSILLVISITQIYKTHANARIE